MGRLFKTAVLGLFLVSSLALAEGELQLSGEDFERLVGQWSGAHAAGKIRQQTGSDWNDPLNLVINEDGSAEFERVEKGKRWDTEAVIVEGKLELGYARKKRLFTISEQAGELKMVLEFRSTRSGESRDNTVTLVKQ